MGNAVSQAEAAPGPAAQGCPVPEHVKEAYLKVRMQLFYVF